MLYFIIFTLTLGFIYFIVLTLFWIGLLKLRNGEGRPTLEQDNFLPKDCLPYVSVVVAARNEEYNLTACLKSLLAQSYPSKQYEVIVVDDHSTDNTYFIAHALATDHPILKVIRLSDTQIENVAIQKWEHRSKKMKLWPVPTKTGQSPMGKQMALDMGIQACRGEIILSTDADCIVPNAWVESMVKASEQKVGVVVGFSMLNERCLKTVEHPDEIGEECPKEHSLTQKYFHRFLRSLFIKLQSLDLLSLFSAFAGGLKMGVAFACTGNNLGYRRRVYDELGGFVNLGSTVAEDNMFLQWVDRYSKWQIKPICHPDVTVSTHPTKTVKEFIRQRLRWASNSTENRPSLVCFMVIVYGFYLFLPFALLFAAFGALSWTLTLIILALKLVPEFLLVLRGLKLFNRMDLLKYFLLLEPCQIVYVLICGICGLLFKIVWKDRKYSSKPITL